MICQVVTETLVPKKWLASSSLDEFNNVIFGKHDVAPLPQSFGSLDIGAAMQIA